MPKEKRKPKNPKIPLIIECALELIRDFGDHGLTMRQVAAKAGMSLSNVQYYFKTKNDLLKGMVDHYCDECEAAFASHMVTAKRETPRQEVEALIEYALINKRYRTQIRPIFLELNAIASRNKEIDAHLKAHFRLYAEGVTEALAPLETHPGNAARATSLLLPFIEGYPTVASALALTSPEVKKQLTDVIMSTLTTPPADG